MFGIFLCLLGTISYEMSDYSTIFQSIDKDSRIYSYKMPKYKDRKRRKKED